MCKKFINSLVSGLLAIAVSMSCLVVPITTFASSNSITVYSGLDYTGRSQTLPIGRYLASNLSTVGNDAIRSIIIPDGIQVNLYEHNKYGGRKLILTSSVNDLCTYNFIDITSSLEVEDKTQCGFYIDSNFSGSSSYVGVGRYTVTRMNMRDKAISSVKVPKGMKVTLYENGDFTGLACVVKDDMNLPAYGFNDKASSVEVSFDAPESGSDVKIYSDMNYVGLCQTLPKGSYNVSSLRIGNDNLSSIYVPNELKVYLYPDKDFSGKRWLITSTCWPELSFWDFDNITSSIIVTTRL